MIAALIRLVSGAQARWAGVEPVDENGDAPKRIYFANHCSNLDAPVIWASLPVELRRVTRPVAARDYWDGGFLRRRLAAAFRVVLIDRKRISAHNSPLTAMEEALDAGDSLIIFPEGSRGGDQEEGEMQDFKPGLWHLGRKHPDVQLVPVHLENLNRILPKGEFLLIPLLAAVTFGSPIRIEEGEEKPAFLERARNAVEALASAKEEG